MCFIYHTHDLMFNLLNLAIPKAQVKFQWNFKTLKDFILIS